MASPEILGAVALPEEKEEAPPLPPQLQELLRDPGTCPELEEAKAAEAEGHQQWLNWEALFRLLGELIVLEAPGLSPEELQALGQLLGAGKKPSVGRETSSMDQNGPVWTSLLPRLLPLLELQLAEKLSEIDQYCSPPGGHVPREGVAKTLANQRRQLTQAQQHQQLLSQSLQELQGAYPQALGRCLELLTRLQGLAARSEALQGVKTQYLEAKGTAILLKTRLEELQLLLDTYPSPTLEAHRKIRAGLQEQLGRAQKEVELLHSHLASFAALGPAFASLAEEFGQVQDHLRQRRWALQQLRLSATEPGHHLRGGARGGAK